MKGAYLLITELKNDVTIHIGKLGGIRFSKGFYVYVGSALNSLLPRLERHLKTSRGEHHVTHWHIDYFLRENPVSIESIYTVETAEHLECDIAKKVSKHGEFTPRFGCSDCRCNSHLYKVNEFEFIEKIGLKKWY